MLEKSKSRTGKEKARKRKLRLKKEREKEEKSLILRFWLHPNKFKINKRSTFLRDHIESIKVICFFMFMNPVTCLR